MFRSTFCIYILHSYSFSFSLFNATKAPIALAGINTIQNLIQILRITHSTRGSESVLLVLFSRYAPVHIHSYICIDGHLTHLSMSHACRMADYSLADLAAFREYDDAMALNADGLLPAPAPAATTNRECRNCGGHNFMYSTAGCGHAGAAVCSDCGAVLDSIVIFEGMHGCTLPTRHSNYRRIHHAHERISQLLIQETAIPAADLMQIGDALLATHVAALNKATVRGVLRSLKMQRYIERWLQIVQRLADASPPRPGPCSRRRRPRSRR
jgi:hypothetical protein